MREIEEFDTSYQLEDLMKNPRYLFTFPPPLLFNIPLKNFSPTTVLFSTLHYTMNHYMGPRSYMICGPHTVVSVPSDSTKLVVVFQR